MDATATANPKGPKPKAKLPSRRDILAELRGLKKIAAPGVGVTLFGHRIAWSRGIRKGIAGRWDPVFVITRPKTKKTDGDSCVLLVEDAADLLFRAQSPDAAQKA